MATPELQSALWKVIHATLNSKEALAIANEIAERDLTQAARNTAFEAAVRPAVEAAVKKFQDEWNRRNVA